DGRRALTGAWQGEVQLWDLETGRRIPVLEGLGGVVKAVAFTPDGRHALIGSESKVRLWDLEAKRLIHSLDRSNWVTAMRIALDGRIALTGCEDGMARLWDVKTGRLI